MDIDFHYYTISILAGASGFDLEDSFTIVHAFQYVDDSRSDRPITIGRDEQEFRPLCTQHIGINAFFEECWRNVYMPFHFLPPAPFSGGEFSFITKPAGNPGSVLPHMILENAFNEPLDETAEGENPNKTRRLKWRSRLCRIGIALHTFADTWAHQGFSGRSHWENDVIDIYERIYNNPEEVYEGRSPFWRLLPPIGHVRIGEYVDKTYFIGKYTRKKGNNEEEVKRNNQVDFIEAARMIYEKLVSAEKPDYSPKIPVVPWEKIVNKIKKLLASREEDIVKRCKSWFTEFEKMLLWNNTWSYFRYDENKWRNEALKIDTSGMINNDEHFPGVELEKFRRSHWYYFHEMAKKQRDFVVSKLPGNLQKTRNLAASAGGNDVDMKFLEGSYLYDKGNYDDAIRCFDEVLENAPGHVPALYYKGKVLERQKKYRTAMVYYKKALEMNT